MNMETDLARTLPRVIDSETEAFSVFATTSTITFNSRTFNYEKSQIPSIRKLKEIVVSDNSRYLCTSPVSKVLIRKKGVKYIYKMYSKSKVFLFDYTVDKRKCNEILPD